jgi:hypothetical protein
LVEVGNERWIFDPVSDRLCPSVNVHRCASSCSERPPSCITDRVSVPTARPVTPLGARHVWWSDAGGVKWTNS